MIFMFFIVGGSFIVGDNVVLDFFVFIVLMVIGYMFDLGFVVIEVLGGDIDSGVVIIYVLFEEE